jgi:hypothetical protein
MRDIMRRVASDGNEAVGLGGILALAVGVGVMCLARTA